MPGAVMPSVPRLAALWPRSSQSCRANWTVEVLPLVPVTAATEAGCRPKKRAASNASRSLGFSSSMTATPSGATVPTGPKTATAPRPTASATKARPSAFVPGSAANSQPGFTARESLVRPAIRGSRAWIGAAEDSSEETRSIRRKGASPGGYVDFGGVADIRPVLVDRADAHQRADLLDDPAGQRGRDPAGGGVAEGALVAFRLIDHHHHQITRVVDREGGDERRQQSLLRIAMPIRFLCRAGLSANKISGRRGARTRAFSHHQAHQPAYLVRSLWRNYA